MKVYFLLIFTVLIVHTASAQLYKPFANAEIEISNAVKQAKSQRKMVLLQVGGNWCSWCIQFNKFCSSEPLIDSILRADYIIYHLNYSLENKNSAILARYGYPERFGFPVFLILDENGQRVHTQNSSYLEQGRSYNTKKVIDFLTQWNRNAVKPAG